MQRKLALGEYSSTEAFAADIRLVWSNARLYNAPMTEVHQLASELSNIFEKRYKHIPKVRTPAAVSHGVQRASRSRSGTRTSADRSNPQQPHRLYPPRFEPTHARTALHRLAACARFCVRESVRERARAWVWVTGAFLCVHVCLRECVRSRACVCLFVCLLHPTLTRCTHARTHAGVGVR